MLSKSSYKKYFCVMFLFMMFCVIVSSGCGGGGGGSDSSGGNNNNQDNGDNGNKLNDSPVEISGTWTIESGRAVLSDDNPSKTRTFSYLPDRIKELGVEIKSNKNIDSYRNVPDWADLYSLTFSGENVVGYIESMPGVGYVNVDYIDDSPYPTSDPQIQFTFHANFLFKWIGNRTYEWRQEIGESPIQSEIACIFTVTLEDSDTLRLRNVQTWDREEAYKKGTSTGVNGWWEIVLKKVN